MQNGKIEVMNSKRIAITQPADWVDAFQTAADKTHNGNLSAWLGDCGRAALPAKIAAKLSERPAANRPKKQKDEGR